MLSAFVLLHRNIGTSPGGQSRCGVDEYRVQLVSLCIMHGVRIAYRSLELGIVGFLKLLGLRQVVS